MLNNFKALIINNYSYILNKFWGLGIGDWGLGIGHNPQSAIPHPQILKFEYYII